ncbi:MAG: hypothetical protein ACLT9P_06560 [Evtepia gabavorous]
MPAGGAARSASDRGRGPCYLENQRSGYLLQNFALFVNLQGETPPPGEGAGAEDLYRLSMGCRAGSPLKEVLTLADLYWTEMEANEDLAVPVRSFQEMERARQAGKIACLLTVEEGGVCLGSLRCCGPFTGWGCGCSPSPGTIPMSWAAPTASRAG